MANWSIAVFDRLRPLRELLRAQIMQGPLVHIDETTVQVMGEPGRPNTSKSYMWVFLGGSAGKPVVDYQYHPTRSGKIPSDVLRKYEGFIQTDGYDGYEELGSQPGLNHVGCWAHARRKFVEALDEQNAEADHIVSELRKLYLLERHAREEALSAEQRKMMRYEKSLPILEAMRPRLEAVREKNLPQSPLGKAARYALNEWAALTKYLEDGRLEIDNNLTENAIRPSAVGKKNWLFIGHPDAGWRAAVIYTLIVSCRRRGIEPWDYLRDVLQRLPAMKQSEITTLLPAHWKPA